MAPGPAIGPAIGPARALYAVRDWGLGMRQKLRTTDEDPCAFRRPGATAVVVLPGVWEGWRVTLNWADALHGAGFDVHFIPELDRVLGSLPELARALRAHLDDRKIHRPIVVAHSKGGLVAKQAMVEDPGRLRGLIACGTPFFGAAITNHLPGFTRLPDLSPQDQNIRSLAAHHEHNDRIVMIEAKWDQNVATLGPLPGSLHCVVPVVGHNRLLDDRATARRIVQFARHIEARWP